MSPDESKNNGYPFTICWCYKNRIKSMDLTEIAGSWREFKYYNGVYMLHILQR